MTWRDDPQWNTLDRYRERMAPLDELQQAWLDQPLRDVPAVKPGGPTPAEVAAYMAWEAQLRELRG